MKEIPASKVSLQTFNPIRSIVDSLHVNPNPNKKFISLALGDPTVSGNFKLAKSGVDSVIAKLVDYKGNGYVPSFGTAEAREAIAKYYSKDGLCYTAEDVILASGCSDALNLCIGVLADQGHNIVLPSPGFSLYETLCSSKGIQTRFYKLKPEVRTDLIVSVAGKLIWNRLNSV
jgi:tyrosine aminotransferase